MKKIKSLKNYHDEMNNKIILSGESHSSPLMSISFSESNALVEIGDNVNICDSEIIIGKGSVLKIGSGSVIKGRINIGAFSKVIIGQKLSVTSNVYLRAVEATSITIGDDCLIASDVIIRTNDGHPIYDVGTKQRINKSRDVVIHDHVWIGDQAVILKGVTIHEGSIIAMRSLVTKDVSRCSVAAGIPASVIRTGTTWEHSLGDFSPQYYD